MKSWITDSERETGEKIQQIMVNTAALWWSSGKMSTTGVLFPMSEPRTQVTEAARARRMRKAKTRTNQKYLKMSRKQLENLEQERRHNLEPIINIRFAVSPESDEEKAIRKRDKINLARRNRGRSKKRKEQRKRQKNSKREAEEGTANRTYRQDVGISIRK